MNTPLFRTPTYDSREVTALAKDCGVSPVTAGALLSRGAASAESVKAFLSLDGRNVFSPFLLPDMDAALDRLELALSRNEPIAIFGDYDADGVTATALLYSYFTQRGLPVSYYIPDRREEGYGLNETAVRQLAAQGVTLIVTVDCGVACPEEVLLARTLGVDVIITDHHECPPTLPDAVAVIDPKRADSRYPFCELAGVGVAFKLVCALEGEAKTADTMARYCDLVTIGTLADVVPLVSENRILIRLGMKRIRTAPRMGLKALLEQSRPSDKPLSATDLTFTVVPRINAAGRMGGAQIGVELLLCEEFAVAHALSKQLCATNDLRRATEQEILKEAEEQLAQEPPLLGKICVVAGEGWHHGVLGIVAARLTERYHTPFLLLTIDGEEAKGSGRSIDGISLFDALSRVSHLLKQFGGHAQAVGLTLETQNLDRLRCEINENLPPPASLEAEVSLDYVAAARELTVPVARELLLLEPFGAGNPPPQIGVFGAEITDIRPVGVEGKHLKLRVADATGSVDCIGFSMGEYAEEFAPGDAVDIAGELGENEFRGKTTPQITLRAMRRCDHGKTIRKSL